MTTKTAQYLMAVLGVLLLTVPDARAQLFEADSKRLGNPKMDIVVKEVERRERASVIDVKINKAGSSVGGSFFLLCSIRQLATLRGNHRYIVKREEQPKHGQMLVGFLHSRDEALVKLGPEFQTLTSPAEVIDLEQFAPICDSMK